jgi:SynChlorMet cassette protein ScmC
LNRGYSLRLSDELCWDIFATEEASPWLGELARIMGLEKKALNCRRRLFCIRGPRDLYNLRHPGIIGHQGPWAKHRVALLDLWRREDTNDIIYDIGMAGDKIENDLQEIAKMSEFIFTLHEEIISKGGLPIHGGLIEKNGIGAILAGPSHAGKSTCCRRVSDDWQALCDDETVMVNENDRACVGHPFPTWSEYVWGRSRKTWNVKTRVPVKAIFFLRQAEKDAIEAMGKGEATIGIYRSAIQKCFFYIDKMEKDVSVKLKREIFHNACHLSNIIPAYTLNVSLHGRFWDMIDEMFEKPAYVETLS